MSEHNKKVETAPVDVEPLDGIVVGDTKKKSSLSKKQKKSLMIILAAIVVLVIAGAVTYKVTRPKPIVYSPHMTASETAQYNQQLANDELSKASDKSDQARIYDTKASYALSVKDYKTALKYAKKADSLAPSDATAYVIATVAEASGDKTTAIAYVHKAISRLDKNDPLYDNHLRDYQNYLIRLQS